MNMRTALVAAAIAMAGGSAALIAAGAAEAQSRGGIVGYVKTCSAYGNGCTSAPVRRGRNGYEYRLPGGTWIECRRNCRNALRETQRENQRD